MAKILKWAEQIESVEPSGGRLTALSAGCIGEIAVAPVKSGCCLTRSS